MKLSVAEWLSELKLTIRSLLRRPVFTATAAITLAVGIGANTAIFSMVHGVLLRALPYSGADRLVTVQIAGENEYSSMSFPDLSDVRDLNQSFSSLVGVGAATYTLTGLGDPAVVQVARVTEGLLQTFQLTPILGRDLRRDEFGANSPAVVVVSYGFWRDRLGADPQAVGKTIQLNATSYEIVGVAPPGFEYPNQSAFWIPRSQSEGCRRGCRWLRTVGRLAPGATLETANLQLDPVARNLEAAYPETNIGRRFAVRNLKTSVVSNVEAGLWIMLGAVSLVLLIACANVANLLLARASARQGELSLRVALGATRWTLARQMLMETGVLAIFGAGLGLAIGYGGVYGLKQLAQGTIPRADQISIDTSVLGMSLVMVVLVTVAAGLVPALTLSPASLTGNIASVGRGGSAGRGAVRFRRTLLAVEVALSATLLIGTGLLLKSFSRLEAVDMGFVTHNIIRFNVVLPPAGRYSDIRQIAGFYQALEQRIAALPGVESVGAMYGAPMSAGGSTANTFIKGEPRPEPGKELDAAVRVVTPGLLSTLGIDLAKGRALTAADNHAGALPVALVDEEFAREFFPGSDAIGRQIEVTSDFGFGSPEWTIVGVVRDARYQAVTQGPRADVYLPLGQFGPGALTVHVRTTPGTQVGAKTIQAAIQEVDPDVPFNRIESMEQVMSHEVAPTRLYLFLVAAFAVMAALLAGVGLYGVMSLIVSQRTKEIGIRMALGAAREGIATLVVRQGMQPVIVGLALGIVGVLAAGRLMEAVLFGVKPRDPAIMAVAGGVMIVVAFIASAVPVVRASKVDPAKVLQGE